jgi:hypothetical protein
MCVCVCICVCVLYLRTDEIPRVAPVPQTCLWRIPPPVPANTWSPARLSVSVCVCVCVYDYQHQLISFSVEALDLHRKQPVYVCVCV